MSGDTATPEGRSPITTRYAEASRLGESDQGAELRLFGALDRDPVSAAGVFRDPVTTREALSVLHAVVASDLRYTPKDRTAYLAWKRLQQQTASQAQWQAQRAYFEWLAQNDPLAWFVLDPVVTVHPDALLWEVFSKDEGTYAQLSIGWDAVAQPPKAKPVFGTTHIDFSDALFDGVQRMRSYRETRLRVGPAAVEVDTDGAPPVIEKTIQVPDSWVRGFLQVQSAATLVRTRCALAPIDLYNALRHLRLNKDTKGKGRAIRIEMVPGEPVRLVLEPWELVIAGQGEPYTGRKAEVIRIWGRRRLMLLQRFLPFTDSVEIHLVGSGLPSFWVLRGGPFSLTLGLTGFTASNWSQALLFDILLPRPDGESDPAVGKVLTHLGKRWHDSLAGIAKSTKLKPDVARRAVQAACQRGQVMYDLAADRFRLRPLLGEPLPEDRLRYRNANERAAHDLRAAGAVKITKVNPIPTVGLELTGSVTLAAEQRAFRPTMLIDDEGRVRKADCTCAAIRKNGLRQGPCAHLIALRLAYADERRKNQGKGRLAVTVETRTFARRRADEETVYQLSLDHQRLRVRWGARGADAMRVQNLVFDSLDEARAAYFQRIDGLAAKGFLDATAE